MKIALLSASSLLLGAFLAVGCGGAAQEEHASDSNPPMSGDTATAAPGEGSDEAWFPDRPDAEKGKVGELKACCYVRCTNSPNWHGPYPGVDYGNCANYGRYLCPQHGWGFVTAKWDQC